MNEAIQTLLERDTLKFVDAEIAQILSAEATLDRSFTTVGRLLQRVNAETLWKPTYKNFGQYVATLCERFHKGRTQLYSFLGVVRDLSPHMKEDELHKVGIKKAELLRFVMKKTGLAPSREVIAQACDSAVSVKQLRKFVFERHHMIDVPRDGNMVWIDIGFYGNAEEASLIQQMLEAARKAAEVDGDLDDPKALKVCMMAIAQDFIGSWGHEETPTPTPGWSNIEPGPPTTDGF